MPSDAAFAVAWTPGDAFGGTSKREALFVQRTSPAGLERAVFVLAEYGPRGWDLAVRWVFLAVDIVLIASLF